MPPPLEDLAGLSLAEIARQVGSVTPSAPPTQRRAPRYEDELMPAVAGEDALWLEPETLLEY